MEQLDIFGALYEEYKITKPIKLIEFFAGYGSQNLALKYLGANYEHHRICEWATKSIQAYNDIHVQDYTDYSQCCSFEEVLNYLFKKGISMNYNEPMTYDQIKRKGETWCRNVYNNIIATKNLVNIQQVSGKDLDIADTETFTYLLTYSFPCQDLSLAGKRKGMAKGENTRSGMLWEVERILKELCGYEEPRHTGKNTHIHDNGVIYEPISKIDKSKLPQILLMENVTQVHSKENMIHFQSWLRELEKLGYSSYWQDLNSADYGVPQNRDRTFVVSILGDYYYEFPKKMPLKLVLADMLEDEVDEKYYLSEKMITYITAHNEKWTGNNDRSLVNKKIASTINTAEGQRRCDASNFIADGLPENTDLKQVVLKIKESTKKGYAEAHEGDGVYINRPHQKRGCVQKGLIQTLKTSPNDVGVVVKVGNYSPSGHNASSIVSAQGIAPTVMENYGTVTAIVEEPHYSDYSMKKIQGNIVNGDVCGTITASAMQSFNHDNCHLVVEEKCKKCFKCIHYYESYFCGFFEPYCRKFDSLYNSPIKAEECGYYKEKLILNPLETLAIRKLTPRECGRLMGVKDSDIDKMSKNQSNSSLYHLFGDSIVVDVLMNIFKKLL